MSKKKNKKKSIKDRKDAAKSMKEVGVAGLSGTKYTGDLPGLFAVIEQQSFSPDDAKFRASAPEAYLDGSNKKGYQPSAGDNQITETRKKKHGGIIKKFSSGGAAIRGFGKVIK